LRIYPPAWILSREALHEDMIGGLKIKKGTQLYISIHGMHSHPKHWEEPGKFKPERFNGGKLPKFTYFPFGGGPRLCIGAELARMEILLSLYKILFTFSFSLVQEVVPEPLITLRPKNGLHLMIQKASENSISFPD
jgi:cytochrome P450